MSEGGGEGREGGGEEKGEGEGEGEGEGGGESEGHRGRGGEGMKDKEAGMLGDSSFRHSAGGGCGGLGEVVVEGKMEGTEMERGRKRKRQVEFLTLRVSVYQGRDFVSTQFWLVC